MPTEKQKMLAGELYIADDTELIEDNRRISAWMDRYNASHTVSPEQRLALLREAFAHAGDGCTICPPFFGDYGYNVRLGAGIGNDAIIGAGSVVTRDVPVGATAVGNPAEARHPAPHTL